MASRGKKVLIGCGAGCLGLLVLGIGSCIGFTVWLDRPGELLEPELLLGPTTVGYAEWTLDSDDPGTQQFVDKLLEKANAGDDQLERLPSFARWLAERKRNRDEQNLRELLPLVAAWTLEPEADGPPSHLLSLSIERIGNQMTFLDWILGVTLGRANEASVVRHGGERIYVVTSDDARTVTFFIHEQDLFFTSDAEAARRALDRLEGRSTRLTAAPSDVQRLFTALPESALRGVLTNRDGALRNLWNELTRVELDDPRIAELWSGLDHATLTGGFAGPTAFEGQLELHAADPEWATRYGEVFVRELEAGLGRTELPYTLTTAVEGGRIRVTFRIDDVARFLDELN